MLSIVELCLNGQQDVLKREADTNTSEDLIPNELWRAGVRITGRQKPNANTGEQRSDQDPGEIVSGSLRSSSRDEDGNADRQHGRLDIQRRSVTDRLR